MVPAGVIAIMVGTWSVYAAVRPRRRTAIAVTARSGVWIGRADLARLASHAAESVPGVLDARSSATLRTITVTARVTAASGMESTIVEAVRDATAITTTPLKIRVRTRTGGR